MSETFRNRWEHLRSSFWFLPSIMATVAGVLALILLQIDTRFPDAIDDIPFVYGGGAEGTRGLLGAISSSSITVAGTTFSITVAVLTLASSNYGPRVLRTFTRNTGNQVVLGTFVATFVYSLLVLRSVRSADEALFVPYLSTTVAIGLAIANIAVLIYFIHHITGSIQASSIIAEIGDDVREAIALLYPHSIGQDQREHAKRYGEADLPPFFERDSVPIHAKGSGYIQTLDNKHVLQIAGEHDLLIKIHHRPGQFVVEGNELVRAWPKDHVTDDVAAHINDAYTWGKERTLTQNVEFGIWQLVDVAIRALSPSLNDPYTAVNCLDQLSVALCDLARRDFPSAYRYDDGNALRVIASPVTFERLLDVAFDEIRQNGNQFVMVLGKMLDIVGLLATRVHSADVLQALRQHAHLIERSSHDGITDEHDRGKVAAHWEATLQAIRTRETALQQEQRMPLFDTARQPQV